VTPYKRAGTYKSLKGLDLGQKPWKTQNASKNFIKEQLGMLGYENINAVEITRKLF
jgi:hypothetical protein